MNEPSSDPVTDTGSIPVPAVRYDLRVLQSLRRIMRAVDLFSHRLAHSHAITAPQLTCLRKVVEEQGLTVSGLSQAIYLSPSTVVGILDRLERRGLIRRERSSTDRRQVRIHPTDAGCALVEAAPMPLQEALADGLQALEEKDRLAIAENLDCLVDMLEYTPEDAAPLLAVEPLGSDTLH